MGLRRPPCAFTELGVAMLASVLKSKRAIQMNIVIMRVFVRLRELVSTHKVLGRRIDQLEIRQKDHSKLLAIMVSDIQSLNNRVASELRKLKAPRRTRSRIGF